MQDNLDQAMKYIVDAHTRQEFNELSPKDVVKFTDKELALFQSQYPSNSPQHVLANNEWQRPLIMEQAKTARLVALVGIVGTLLGAVVGHLLTKW